MVGVSASVNLPLHHKFQKFPSGIGSPGWSRKNGRKIVVVVVFTIQRHHSRELEHLLPEPNALVDISKGMCAVKLCSNEILQFLSGGAG